VLVLKACEYVVWTLALHLIFMTSLFYFMAQQIHKLTADYFIKQIVEYGLKRLKADKVSIK